MASGILESFIPEIKGILTSESSLEEMVSGVVDLYFTTLQDMPELPVFIFTEVNRDVRNLVDAGLNEDIRKHALEILAAIHAQMDEGKIRKMPVLHILQSFYALLIIPFIARPIALQVLGADTLSEEYFKSWKEEVVRHMIFTLTP